MDTKLEIGGQDIKCLCLMFASAGTIFGWNP